MARRRAISSYVYDSKRALQGRSPEYLKLYIGRQIIHMLNADELYEKQTQQSILAPSVRKALLFLRDLALLEKPDE